MIVRGELVAFQGELNGGALKEAGSGKDGGSKSSYRITAHPPKIQLHPCTLELNSFFTPCGLGRKFGNFAHRHILGMCEKATKTNAANQVHVSGNYKLTAN